jgi:hypothetical protein
MTMRGRVFALFSLAACLGVLGACGSSNGNDETPAACLNGPDAYLKALAAAPGEVRLAAGTLISDCLVAGQDAGELATAGRAMVVAATRLNAEASSDSAGTAPAELGYLVGAVKRGSGETGGIHADLVRRLEAAARFSPGELPAQFERGYEEGYAAGAKSG